MASAPQLQHPRLQRLCHDLEHGPLKRIAARLCGAPVGKLLMRSWVHLPGTALLPHADWRPEVPRMLAVVLYLHHEAGAGGQLVLHEPALAEGRENPENPASWRDRPRPAARIEPRANRLVLMRVDANSVHEIEEVTAGARCALAGWFYAPGHDPLAQVAKPTVPDCRVLAHHHLLSPAALGRLREETARVSWRRHVGLTTLRAEWAGLSAEGARQVVLATSAEWPPEVGDGDVLGGVWLRLGPGDYALSKGLSRLRPLGSHVTITVDLRCEGPLEGAELVWHGGHGNIVAAVPQEGAVTVVEHREDVGMYQRRLARLHPGANLTRLLIFRA